MLNFEEFKSQRNGRLIIFENYFFNFLKDFKTHSIFRCRLRSCQAKLYVYPSKAQLIRNHNHESPKDKVLMFKFDQIQKKAKQKIYDLKKSEGV